MIFKANFKPRLVMGLLTWIAVVVTILAIMGLGWNVFVSGVYKGARFFHTTEAVQKVWRHSGGIQEYSLDFQTVKEV